MPDITSLRPGETYTVSIAAEDHAMVKCSARTLRGHSCHRCGKTDGFYWAHDRDSSKPGKYCKTHGLTGFVLVEAGNGLPHRVVCPATFDSLVIPKVLPKTEGAAAEFTPSIREDAEMPVTSASPTVDTGSIMAALADALAKTGIDPAAVLGLPPKPEAKPVSRFAPKVSRIAASDSWSLVTAAATSLPRVLLYGPPGTGKTYLALSAGVDADMPTYRINMTEDTPAAELRGHYVPSGDGWHWQDGPAMRAFRNGGRLVIDEITRAADDALSFTLALLDGHPITLPSGETVERHSDFSVWATTNDDPTALSDALADRFTVRVKCDKVNPEALDKLPAHLRSSVSAGADSGISYRQAQEYARLSEDPQIRELSKVCGRDIAAQLVWEARGRDVASGFKLAGSPDYS